MEERRSDLQEEAERGGESAREHHDTLGIVCCAPNCLSDKNHSKTVVLLTASLTKKIHTLSLSVCDTHTPAECRHVMCRKYRMKS